MFNSMCKIGLSPNSMSEKDEREQKHFLCALLFHRRQYVVSHWVSKIRQ